MHTKTAGPPWRYVELVLCRDVYHCRPSELAGEDLRTVLEHLTCVEVEAEVRKLEGGQALES